MTSVSTPKRGRRAITAREASERFGRSPRTIRRLVAEERVAYEQRAAERHERARELRAQGLSIRAIAAELGCSRGVVEYALKKAEKAPAA